MEISKLLLAKLEKRLRLDDLSALTGCSPSHISRILRGERESKRLNQKLEKLLRDDDDNKS